MKPQAMYSGYALPGNPAVMMAGQAPAQQQAAYDRPRSPLIMLAGPPPTQQQPAAYNRPRSPLIMLAGPPPTQQQPAAYPRPASPVLMMAGRPAAQQFPGYLMHAVAAPVTPPPRPPPLPQQAKKVCISLNPADVSISTSAGPPPSHSKQPREFWKPAQQTQFSTYVQRPASPVGRSQPMYPQAGQAMYMLAG